jgi:hypothetical protein
VKKLLLRLLGWLFALAAALYFLRYASHALSGRDLSGLLDRHVLTSMTVMTVLYMLLIPSTAAAWTWLLGAMGQPARYEKMLPILATTQFGKYLPGNVAQHIGRVALATRNGVQLPAALFSIAYELLLMLVACAHLSALTLLWAPPAALANWKVTEYRGPLLIVVTVGAVMALLLAPKVAAWLTRLRAKRNGEMRVGPISLHLDVRTVAACYVTYALNFCLVGAGLWLVSRALLSDAAATPSWVFLTGAFASSWILGFVAPGAPAGLGVREALLSAWLSGSLPAAQVVLLVVSLRIATSLGDLLNFALGSAFMNGGKAAA